MSYARQMLDACPRVLNVDTGLLAATLEALNDCTQACVADSDCDLGEQNVIVHPAVPGLCRCLHRYRRGPKPPGGVRPQSYRAAPWGLRGGM